jgi:uncharacterized delta-60 repeat protein
MSRRTCRALLRPLLAVLVGALSVTAPAHAAPGALDLAFGASGWSLVPPGGQLAVAGGVVVQPDGRIVTAGMRRLAGGTDVELATRMLADGTLDQSFGAGGVVALPIGLGACANTLRLQPDGKIVLAGTGELGGRLVMAAVRLLPDGTPDPTFGTAGVATVNTGGAGIANGVAVLPDGRIALAGTARPAGTPTTSNQFAVARLTADGRLDTTFGTDGVTRMGAGGSGAWGLAVTPDGGLVMGGQTPVDASTAFMTAKVRPDGTPDATFGTSGIRTTMIGTKAVGNAIAVQPDGRVLVTGNAFDGRGVAATIRLLADGTPDPSFGTAGVSEQTLWQAVNGFALQPDGKIVLGATGGSTVRLTAAGQPDATFGVGGLVIVMNGSKTAANGVAVARDGGLIMAGVVTLADATMPLAVWRLEGDPLVPPPPPPAPDPAPTATTTTTTTTTPPPTTTTVKKPKPVKARAAGVSPRMAKARRARARCLRRAHTKRARARCARGYRRSTKSRS